MSLSGQQRKQLQSALMDAFPTMVSLEQMLAFELDKSLRAIVGEGSLQEIVFKLIQTADSRGWVEDLICAACNSNIGNQKLQNFIQIQKLILKKSNDLRRIIEERLECEYDNLEELGTGAFGITYLATIKNEQKDIVIKTLKLEEVYQVIKSNTQEDLKQFNQTIKSFKKEAETLSNFPKHPNIVGYYNHLTQKCKFLMINNSSHKQGEKRYSIYEVELVFLLMEYIEGENLEELASKRDSPLEEAEALRYIRQIGEALTVVHSKNVLHRDIKPKNIMVRKTTNDAVLIDFGIAREFKHNVTQTHTVSFTQGYAPPEQLDPKAKRGNYTDIYGLAATLFYLLTKEHPSHALLRSIQPLDEPKKLNSNISDMVNKAILWGMELEFSNRPQTVQEWLAEFPSKEARVELKPPQEVPTQSSILESAPAEQQRREQEQAEYKNNLRLYEQEFAKVVQAEYPLSEAVLQRLKTYQQQLGLLNEDVERAEQPIREPAEAKYQEKLVRLAEQQRLKQEQAEYENKLHRYEQELYRALEAKYPLDDSVRNELKKNQQSLGIRDDDIVPIEQRLLTPKQAEYELQQEAIKLEQEQVILENFRLQAELKEQEQRKSSLPISNSDDDLSSDLSIDYTQLRDFLKAGQWKEADNETYLVMLKVVGRKEGDWIRPEELVNFPCTDLRTIDSLWVKYSNGRFGFSVQKKIYLSVGGKPDGKFHREAWKEYGVRVGWKVKGSRWISYTNVTFTRLAPEGHLPYLHLSLPIYVTLWSRLSSLASRLVNCNI